MPAWGAELAASRIGALQSPEILAMVIMSRFVYLHMPKTGGTFVTKVLERLSAENGRFIDMRKHGRCIDIPWRYRRLPVVGCIRNPYDRYVSQYRFKWWREHPQDFPGILEHPSFPDLSLDEFVHLANARWRPAEAVEAGIGWHTWVFISYYCRSPKRTLARVERGHGWDTSIKGSLVPEAFLRTGSLNEDLYAYLLTKDYHPEQVGFVLSSPRIMPREGGREASDHWGRYYSPELKAFVRHQEQFLFDLFPEFDV